MRYCGTLMQWNDQRGFGWIDVDGGGERLFVHIRAFEQHRAEGKRPQAGQRLEFSVGLEQGKKRALQVTWPAGVGSRSAERTSRAVPRSSHSAGRSPSSHIQSQGWHASRRFSYSILLGWLLLMLAVAVTWGVPRIVGWLYAGLSVLSFVLYWQDKCAARKGQWRISEKTLQTLALAGGWPGAVLAQQWLRHKSSKTRFQLQFWLMVLMNVGAVMWWCSPYGRNLG